ncbi:MAG: toll/interleukin-1 receptor domain-containing protein [Chloroflexi bacterium]|nr:toll/interleukin-1 receptor domain-containing protein [Chloroflexota bacterium]MCC6896625.1 toll/interleukin-1 receptor domain-containing protein [Anaerolineae bacterium]
MLDQPQKIFINYRRSLNKHVAGRIFSYLKDTFGDDRLFFDTAYQDLGGKWPAKLTQEVMHCSVLLVIIGDNWLTELNSRSKTKERDWVREEINTVFKQNRDCHIIPVLIDDAKLPLEKDANKGIKKLIKKLVQLEAVVINHHNFDQDMANLAQYLRVLIDPSSSVPVKLPTYTGIVKIHETFPSNAVQESIREAKEIRILTTWITNWPDLEYYIEIAAKRGIKIRVLLIDPDCEIAERRNEEIAPNNGSANHLNVRVENKSHIVALYRKLKAQNYKLDIKLRYYDVRPSVSLYLTDQTSFLGFFLHSSRMVSAPAIEFQGTDKTYLGRLQTEFKKVWNKATIQIDLETGNQNHIERP